MQSVHRQIGNQDQNNSYTYSLETELNSVMTEWRALTSSGFDLGRIQGVLALTSNLEDAANQRQLLDIADTCSQLQVCTQRMQAKRAISQEDIFEFNGISKDLTAKIELSPSGAQKQDENNTKKSTATTTPKNFEHKGPVLKQGNVNVGILSQNPDEIAALKACLLDASYSVNIYSNQGELENDMNEGEVDLALVDILLPDCPKASEAAIEELLSENSRHIPVVVLSDHVDLRTRLIALRAGMKEFISKPIQKEELLHKLDYVLSLHNNHKTKLLMVDDDEVLTEFYTSTLREDGFECEALNDPLDILSSIEDFQPDIIVLDFELPHCNGLEVAEILHGDEHYAKIPVVFLTSSENSVKQRSLFDIYGEKILEKPLDVDELAGALNEIAARLSLETENDSNAHEPSTNTNSHSIKLVATEKSLTDNKKPIEQNEAPTKAGEPKIKLVHPEKNTSNIKGLLSNTQCQIKLDKILKENTGYSPHKNQKYLAVLAVKSNSILSVDDESNLIDNLQTSLDDYLAGHRLISGIVSRLDDFKYLALLDIPPNEASNVQRGLDIFLEVLEQDCANFVKTNIQPKFSLAASEFSSSKFKDVDSAVELLDKAAYEMRKGEGSSAEIVKPTGNGEMNQESLKKAIESKSFDLHYQPIVQPDTDDNIFDVLVRLIDDKGDVHPPSDFLPYIDGLVEEGSYYLDRWVIEHAFRNLEKSRGPEAQGFSIIIKLTPILKQVERLLPFIYNEVSNSRLRGQNRIYFSLPEKVLLQDERKSKLIIKAIRNTGCGFVIENSMATEATAKFVKDAPKIDFVKLDQNFPVKSGKDEAKNKITALSEALGTPTALIASVVEDAFTFASYWEMNVRYFQGYFIDTPDRVMKKTGFEGESLTMDR